MGGPWEAFQDANAAQLSQNDPIAAPSRAPVQSSPRVWGDSEAQQAGLYEKPTSGPWEAFKSQAEPQGNRAPTRITVRPVRDRFADIPQVGVDGAQEGLQQRATQLTQGPAISPSGQMALQHANVLSAASQGTSPHIEGHQPNLLSTQVQEDDAGNLWFKDPQTGQLIQTDNSKHVALRDPIDNTIKVFSRADATNENSVVGASRVLSQGLLTGAPTKRAMIGAVEKLPRGAVQSGDVIKSAQPDYKAFDRIASGVGIGTDEQKLLVDRVQRAMDSANFPKEVARQAHDVVGLLDRGEPVTLEHLQAVKRAATNLLQSPDPNVKNAAKVATKEIVRIIGEKSSEAGAKLSSADATHSAGKALQKVEQAQSVADLRRGRAGYGGNAVNTIRQVLSPFVERSIKGSITGFKPDEIAAMKDIIEGTRATNLARQVGATSPSKGGIQIGNAIGTPILAAATLGPIGAAAAASIPVLGMAGNKIATVLTNRQFDLLREKIAKRSPKYAEAVANAINRYERTQLEFVNQPTTKAFAAYVASTRALSAGMNRDGIKVTSGEFLKAISGPPKAAADSEQNQSPDVPGQQ